MRKIFLSTLFAAALGIGSIQAADIVVKLKPPALKIEKRPARPGPEYVWVGGYHKWDGSAYVWTPGEWQKPPREHAVWVSPKWEHRSNGYVFVEGRWK